MFLDDELLQIGRSTELTHEGVNESAKKMIKACFDSLENQINNNHDENIIRANFKRVNNTWIKACTQLHEEGLCFARIDGFKLFVEQRPAFEGVFFNQTK